MEFQILKDDAVKVLHSICQHIWKTQQWPQDWKRSVFIPIPKKGYVFPFRPQLLAETEHSAGPHGSSLLDSGRFSGRGSPLQHGAPFFHETAFFMGILPCPWPCVLWPVPSFSGCLAWCQERPCKGWGKSKTARGRASGRKKWGQVRQEVVKETFWWSRG